MCKKNDFCWLGLMLPVLFTSSESRRKPLLTPSRLLDQTGGLNLDGKKWSATGLRRTIPLSLSRCQRTRVIIRSNVLCVIIPRVCVWGAPRLHTTQNVNPRLCFLLFVSWLGVWRLTVGDVEAVPRAAESPGAESGVCVTWAYSSSEANRTALLQVLSFIILPSVTTASGDGGA